jgi:3-hydroxybutyryl-CoA dehydratase
MTLYLEDLKAGMSATLVHTVTDADIEAFGVASGDRNPVHFDEAFAKTTLFKGRVAHGALLLAYVSNVIGNQLPGSGTIFMGASVAFKAPVRPGDTVTVTCTVAAIEGRKVTLDCACTVGSTVVAEVRAEVLAPRKPAEKA